MENKLPDGWEWKKLEDLHTNGKLIFQNGFACGKNNQNGIGLPQLRPMNINSNGKIDLTQVKFVEVAKDTARYILQKEDVIFNNTNSQELVGKTAVWDEELQESVLSNHMTIIRLSADSEIFPRYLAKYLHSLWVKRYFEQICTNHINQSSVGINRLKDIEFPLPPLETQQKIVSILEKAEETKKLRAQADELTQKLLQSVFLEMFGDPIENSRGWNVRKLGEIITDSMNGLYLPKEKYTSHDGIKMVHMSDAFYGIVELGNLKRVLATKKEIDKYGLTKNDLLVARRSLNFEGAAKASRIPELNEPLIFESSLVKVSPNLKLVTTIYLYHYLNNELVRKTYIYKHITKSTISGINQNSLKNISVILPPIEVQNKFSDFVEQAEKTILNQQQSSLEINNLFDALMQKAFTGELVS